ncbi:MAG: rhamnogalacturonan acetylesterase [Acidobacteriota bacterium]|nr:rhamnogalacturonan acetylesterase [Acidobacteriota bacterium]
MLKPITLLLAGLATSGAVWAQQPAPLNPSLPTIFVAGDSTASNTDHRGWGDPFIDYFDPAKVNVLNRARAGRSARTFLNEGLWDQILADMKAGDYVLIQFGHNDGSAPDKAPFRGDLHGIGEESQEVTGQAGKTETVYTFGWYLRKFINDAKAKGAHLVVLSLTVRNIWQDGKVERGSGQFSRWSQDVAQAEKVPFVDVMNAIADVYDGMGADKVKSLFPIDHTHTSQEGAQLVASIIVGTLKGSRVPFANYLSAKGAAITPIPALAALHLNAPANPNLPTLFLIGDSTVRNGHGDGSNGQWGWGEPIVELFDTTKINVVNRAVGGLSSRTFLTGGYWAKALAMMKPGDYVLMQFGHNDGGKVDGPTGYRSSLPGVGDETQQAGGSEMVHTFGWYLKQFIADTRAKGATPIVCSLIPRKIWKDGKISRNSDDFGGWAQQVAISEKTPFIDLNEIIAREYDKLGEAKVEPMFADPHTHTSRIGAELNARAVISGLKALSNDPLAPYLSSPELK